MWYPQRRVRRHVADTAVQAMFYGHPDLIVMETVLDEFYSVPGDQNDPPNRTADPEVLSALRRRVFPFEDRTESFWPAGFDPDVIEAA
jgi:hypothetical protein